MTTPELYIAAQKEFVKTHSLKVGDEVKVLRKAKTEELGWELGWNENMNKLIGQTLKIYRIHPSKGIRVCESPYFSVPFFVLEPTNMTPVIVKVNETYDAEIYGSGDIKVGCQEVSFENLEAIYLKAKERRG